MFLFRVVSYKITYLSFVIDKLSKNQRRFYCFFSGWCEK